MIRLIFLSMVMLSGCAAIQVTETETSCTLSGAVVEPGTQAAPQADFDFRYEGERCFVNVSNEAE